MSLLATSIVIVQGQGEDEQELVSEHAPQLAARVEAIGTDLRSIELVPLSGELFEERIQASIDEGVTLLLTFGGTGVGPDDIVPELTSIIVERRVPGVEERLRRAFSEESPEGALERGACGTSGATLVINLPRDLGLATAGLASLAPLLPAIATQLADEPDAADER